jgi:hypothetical protein
MSFSGFAMGFEYRNLFSSQDTSVFISSFLEPICYEPIFLGDVLKLLKKLFVKLEEKSEKKY